LNTESVQLRKALYNGILWTAARHFEWGVDAEGGWGFVASPKGENVGVWGRSPQKDVPGTPWLPVGRRMSCACMAAAIGKTPVECMPLLYVCLLCAAAAPATARKRHFGRRACTTCCRYTRAIERNIKILKKAPPLPGPLDVGALPGRAVARQRP